HQRGADAVGAVHRDAVVPTARPRAGHGRLIVSAPVAPWTGATNADVWTIDGLTFNAGADANGVEWIINSDTGWFGSAPSRNNRVSKNNAHGAYRSPVYRDP